MKIRIIFITIFVILMLSSVSILSPALNYNKKDLKVNHFLNKDISTITFGELCSFIYENLHNKYIILYILKECENKIKDSFINNFLDDFEICYNVVNEKIICDINNEKDINDLFFKKIIPMILEIQIIFNGEKNINEISEELDELLRKSYKLLENNTSNNQKNNEIIYDDNTSQYLKEYFEALDIWTSLTPLRKNETNSFGKWWTTFDSLTQGPQSLLTGINLGYIMAITAMLVLNAPPIIVFAAINLMTSINLISLYHFKKGNNEYWDTKNLEINLNLILVNKNNTGITGLADECIPQWTDYNNYEENFSYYKVDRSHFEYIFEENYGFEGIYTLKTKFDDKRYQPPFPSGNYNITIKPSKFYDGKNLSINEIEESTSNSGKISLNARPNVTIEEGCEHEQKVGDTCYFIIRGDDNDNDSVYFLIDWDDNNNVDEWFYNTSDPNTPGYFSSGENVTIYHEWKPSEETNGQFIEIHFWTKDKDGAISYDYLYWQVRISK